MPLRFLDRIGLISTEGVLKVPVVVVPVAIGISAIRIADGAGNIIAQIVPAVDAVVTTESVEIESTLLFDRILVDEPAEGGTVIS